MSKVSVTIEGASWGDVRDQMMQFVSVAYSEPVLLESQVVTVPAETFKPFPPAAESWPAGQCPKHLRPWKDGKFGPYCSARDEAQPKGYCVLKPGDIWNGKNIPLVAA